MFRATGRTPLIEDNARMLASMSVQEDLVSRLHLENAEDGIEGIEKGSD